MNAKRPGESDDEFEVRCRLEQLVIFRSLREARRLAAATAAGEELEPEQQDLLVATLALSLHHDDSKKRLREGGAKMIRDIIEGGDGKR